MKSHKESGHLIPAFTLIAVITALAILHIGCTERDIEAELTEIVTNNARTDVNQFILEKVEQNRIVIMADAGHGVRRYMQTVISFIEHWIKAHSDTTATSTTTCKDLVVVLERDPLQLRKYLRYGETGVITDVPEYASLGDYQLTTATLEFYTDLARLRKTVESYNQHCDSENQINFALLGAEHHIDLDDWTYEKRDQYFIHERDSLSAANVSDFLDENPQSKAVLFYGGAHLQRGHVLKTMANPPTRGYFIAHHLTERFGESDGVYIIDQIGSPNRWQPLSSVFAKPGVNFAIDHGLFDFPITSDTNYIRSIDGSITMFDRRPDSKQVYHIVSRAMVEFILKELPLRTNMQNQWHKKFWLNAIAYLITASGAEPNLPDLDDPEAMQREIEMWREWYRNSDPDFVADIENLALWERQLSRLEKCDTAQARISTLLFENSLGVTLHHSDSWTPKQIADQYRDHINDNRRLTVVENLVHLLWVGTDKERADAVKVLQEEMGESYGTPKEWMVWWSGKGWTHFQFKEWRKY